MNLIQTLAKIVTDSEERNRIFRSAHLDMVADNRLYRFNVDQGLAAVGLEEYKSVDQIANSTDRYLDDPDVMRSVGKCAELMRDGGQRLDLLGGEGKDYAQFLETPFFACSSSYVLAMFYPDLNRYQQT